MKITIEVNEMADVERLMQWLRENKFLDEIMLQSAKPAYKPTIKRGDKSIDPKALEGVWKDNPRTLEEIRKAAWGEGL